MTWELLPDDLPPDVAGVLDLDQEQAALGLHLNQVAVNTIVDRRRTLYVH